MTEPPSLLASSVDPPSAPSPHLQGRGLLVARIVWLGLAASLLANFIASIPAYAAHLLTVCTNPHSPQCNSFQLSPAQLPALHQVGLSLPSYAAIYVGVDVAVSLVYLLVGALIFWRTSDHWWGLFFSFVLFLFGAFGIGSSLILGFVNVPANPPVALMLAVVLLVCLQWGLLGAFLLTFPTGRFAPGWSWVVVILCEAGALLFLTSAISLAPSVLFLVVFLLTWGSIAAVQFYRYRRLYTPVQRQQTKWVVFGYAVGVVVNVVLNALGALIPQLGAPNSPYQFLVVFASVFLNLLIPLSVGIAILRYQLWDIDIIIKRTLVYGALTSLVIGMYVLIVGILSTLLHTPGNVLISLLATGLIAVLFQPLRARLQRMVNRLIYGERDDPYAVLSHLGGRLEATLVPEKVLPTIVETVAQTLKLPYVAIALLPEGPRFTGAAAMTTVALALVGAQETDIVASFGTPVPDLVRVPLVYQADTIGYLLLATRTGDTFGQADSRLLTDLARQAGVAVYAARLTTQLQRLTTNLQQARERLVTTREEERRRLRRDLHDGLGPQLSSQTLTLSAARKLLRQDPDAVDRLLEDATTHAQEAITDIRRLVYGLRPPALDDLGLLAALQEQLTEYHASGVCLILDAPELLPPLPAAVEVACYRIMQEALTNVMYHAHAHTCTIQLTVDTHLKLEIRDDGQGLPPAYRRGIGLTSMRERAEELGGTCTITGITPGGTRVLARLPLA